MKLYSLILILLFTRAFSFAQTQNKKVEAVKEKYKLCEYLLSCQSMAHTIIGENDNQMKRYLCRKGLDYYNNAYQEYIKLQDPQYDQLSEDLRKIISAVMEIYAKTYNDITFLNTPNSLLAMSFIDNIYEKKILPGLWDNK